jgi:aryl-alcohol dehydrogenase-like predicted oxidoreductase
MGMSAGVYGPADRAESIATIRAALDAGIDLALVEKLRVLAQAKGATVAQVAIAWVMARGDDVVALVGARTRERLTEALGAEQLEMDADDLEQLERAIPPQAAVGERYPCTLRVNLELNVAARDGCQALAGPRAGL